MQNRIRRPYEKKIVSKGGALIFGLGLGALLATIAIIVGMAIPNISTRLEYLPYYARTYYRKLVPHPEYLPTPAPTVSAPVTAARDNDGPIELNLPLLSNEPPAGEVIPAASIDSAPPSLPDTGTNTAGDVLSLPKVTNKTLLPVSDQVNLVGMTHQWQTWNNCGPATITMNTSYFDRPETQVEAAKFLKPNRDDKNVSPHELAAYVRTLGFQAIVRQGGSIDRLKMFLSNNLPVLTETWLVHDGDGLGHYRLLTGYDDATGQFNTFDSLNGANHKVSYEQFDSDWRVFNRLYLVVFPSNPEQAELVSAIIGEDIDDTVMYERILSLAQAEIEANPNDAIAYFNQGEALTRLGRHQEAVVAFDRARQLGLHWRRLWYQFTPFEAYSVVDRYQDVLDLTEATIEGTGGLEEAYYYQGLALHTTGQTGATDAFQAAIAYNPNFDPAKDALSTLREDR